MHELFAGDGFLFIEVFCQRIERLAVVLENLNCLFVLALDELDDHFVDLLLRGSGTGKRRIAAAILVAACSG